MAMNLKKAQGGTGIAQQSVFAIIFGFFITGAGKSLLMENPLIKHAWPLQVVLFPLAVLFEVVELVLALVAFDKASNKNADQTMQLLLTFAKVTMVTVAISLGVGSVFAGAALPAAVPILFTITLSMGTLNSLVRAIYHGTQLSQRGMSPTMKAEHRQAMYQNIIRTVVGGMLTGSIVGLFLLDIHTTLGLILLSVMGLLAVGIGIMATVVPMAASRTAPAPTTTETTMTKDKLLEKIANKITLLDAQSKSSKRLAKKEGLNELQDYLNWDTTKNPASSIEGIIAKHEGPGLFQSFWRQRGEVEELFDLARELPRTSSVA